MASVAFLAVFAARERAGEGHGVDAAAPRPEASAADLQPLTPATGREAIHVSRPTTVRVRVHASLAGAEEHASGGVTVGARDAEGRVREERLALREGECSLPAGVPGTLRILACEIDGRVAEILDVRHSAGASADTIHVDCALGFGSWVRTHDARGTAIERGLRLTAVARTGAVEARTASGHPGPTPPPAIVRDAVEAPFWLPAEPEHPREWWVQADGTTWARIPLHAERVGQCELELADGADLDVLVTNGALEPGMNLRIVGPLPRRSVLSLVNALKEAPAEFRGLPAGKLEVRLLAGHDGAPLQLAVATVELAAGDERRLELALPRLEPLPVAGSLRARVELSDEVLADHELREQLVLELVARVQTDELRRSGFTPARHALEPDATLTSFPRVQEWVLPEVAPGEYSLRLHPLALAVDVRVDPGQETRSTITLPELGRAWLTFVSEDARMPQEVQAVSVRAPGSGASVRVEPLHAGGPWSFSVVPGEYAVTVRGSGPWIVQRTIEVRAGSNAFDLELARPIELRVELVTEGEPQPVPMAWWFEVQARSVGHTGSLTGRRSLGSGGESGSAGAVLTFDAPGAYELTFPALPDGRTPPAHPIVVQRGTGQRERVVIAHRD